MALVTLEEAKRYLRVDSADEDAVTSTLLSAAERLCADVARLSDEKWTEVDSDEPADVPESHSSDGQSPRHAGITYRLGRSLIAPDEAGAQARIRTL